MSDIVERLRAIPVWMVGMMAPGWQEHGTAAYKAADEIAALRAENARLTEERDALAEALRPFACIDFECTIVDEQGWSDFGVSWSGEPIKYWFGPTDFRNARAALKQQPD